MARKKPETEGLAALVEQPAEVPSIQEITMLDWYAGFALLSMGSTRSEERMAIDAFDIAEACMAERTKRV